MKKTQTFLGRIRLFIITAFLLVVGATASAQQTILTLGINQREHDAEQTVSNGSMNLSSDNLELGNQKIVGLYIPNVTLQRGAKIDKAIFSFNAHTVSSGNASVRIYAQNTVNPSGFSNSSYNISSRPKTTAYVDWNIAPWTIAYEIQNSVDVAPLINELISRPDWVSGSPMVFIFERNNPSSATRYAHSIESFWATYLFVYYDPCSPEMGAPVFASGATSQRCQAAENVTYTANSANSTSISYSLDSASLAAGNTINASTGIVTYVASWSGTSIITVTAEGCKGPKTATHTATSAYCEPPCNAGTAQVPLNGTVLSN